MSEKQPRLGRGRQDDDASTPALEIRRGLWEQQTMSGDASPVASGVHDRSDSEAEGSRMSSDRDRSRRRGAVPCLDLDRGRAQTPAHRWRSTALSNLPASDAPGFGAA